MTYEMYSDLIFENAEKFVHFVKTYAKPEGLPLEPDKIEVYELWFKWFKELDEQYEINASCLYEMHSYDSKSGRPEDFTYEKVVRTYETPDGKTFSHEDGVPYDGDILLEDCDIIKTTYVL